MFFLPAQLPAAYALGTGDDRSEGGTQGYLDVRPGRAPVAADPRAAVEWDHDMLATVAVAAHHHTRIVVHVAERHRGCITGHCSRTADSVPSALRWRCTGVQEMSSMWWNVVSIDATPGRGLLMDGA
ncbi:MAG: hypothetical protein CL933_16730 [Deltaproteobacteria bacterium]|nr:hypothetical protein [Deltaproteobacteria bacterium]